jgi:hypothetical protein
LSAPFELVSKLRLEERERGKARAREMKRVKLSNRVGEGKHGQREILARKKEGN